MSQDAMIATRAIPIADIPAIIATCVARLCTEVPFVPNGGPDAALAEIYSHFATGWSRSNDLSMETIDPVTASGEASRISPSVFALVAASVLWGTTGTAASFMSGGVSPVAIGAVTMGVGGLLLFVFSARAAIAAIRDRAARGWLALGAVGVFIYPLAFYSSMDMAGIAIGNVLSLGTGPVFAAVLEWVGERRGLTKRWMISTTVAVAGVATLGLAGRDQADWAGSDLPLGVLLGIVAGASYALYTYSSTRAIRLGHGGRPVMGATFGMGAVALAPLLLLTGQPIVTSTSNVAIAAYLAIGPMFIAYLFFGFALRALRSSTATTITLIEPIVATVLAVLVVGERLSPLGWSGVLLIFVGVTVLVAARPAKHSAHSP